MSKIQAVAQCTADGTSHSWEPTTLDRIGKSEEFFESVLAATPDLLGLRSRRSGIHAPFATFRQLPLRTPSGRSVCPDLVFLTASGHVVVVEVKRSINPELRDRAVIAQIIDYASSFASLTEADALALFRGDAAVYETWSDLVHGHFPGVEEPDDLADVLLGRMTSGELNLVIACDGVPPGLPEIVRGIASQRTLGFELDLVEVVPYVRTDAPSADILFVPTTRLRTEIVARTVVTVNYREGDALPSTTVEMTPLEEIEHRVESARQSGNPLARVWTPAEVDGAVERDGDATMKELLRFVKQHGAREDYIAPGAKLDPSFGFYIQGREGGKPLCKMLFCCYIAKQRVTIYLRVAKVLVDEVVFAEFQSKLAAVLESAINVEKDEPGIPISALARSMQPFQELIRWFQRQAANRLGELTTQISS